MIFFIMMCSVSLFLLAISLFLLCLDIEDLKRVIICLQEEFKNKFKG